MHAASPYCPASTQRSPAVCVQARGFTPGEVVLCEAPLMATAEEEEEDDADDDGHLGHREDSGLSSGGCCMHRRQAAGQVHTDSGSPRHQQQSSMDDLRAFHTMHVSLRGGMRACMHACLGYAGRSHMT